MRRSGTASGAEHTSARTCSHVSGRRGTLVDCCSETVADRSSSDRQVAPPATKEKAHTGRGRRSDGDCESRSDRHSCRRWQSSWLGTGWAATGRLAHLSFVRSTSQLEVLANFRLDGYRLRNGRCQTTCAEPPATCSTRARVRSAPYALQRNQRRGRSARTVARPLAGRRDRPGRRHGRRAVRSTSSDGVGAHASAAIGPPTWSPVPQAGGPSARLR